METFTASSLRGVTPNYHGNASSWIMLMDRGSLVLLLLFAADIDAFRGDPIKAS